MIIKIKKTRGMLEPDLRKKMRASQNPERVLRAMGTVFAHLAVRAFNEPALRPAPWAPLAASTLKAKAAKGQSNAILKATGALMRSPRLVKVTKRTIQVESDRRYAPYHQEGIKGRLPRRAFFPVYKNGNLIPRAAKLVNAAAKRVLDSELGMR